jgi:hypothetical protein
MTNGRSSEDAGDEIERRIADSMSDAMPEIRARSEKIRLDVAAFFEIPVAHLPPEGSDGWSRLLATYVWTIKPEFGTENLRHMLDRRIFNTPEPR